MAKATSSSTSGTRTKLKEASAVPPAPTFIDACCTTFGKCPADVIAPINYTAEALMQLHEIFKTISNEALNDGRGFRIKALADAGAYIANDISNFAGYEHEAMIGNLKAAGLVQAEGGAA